MYISFTTALLALQAISSAAFPLYESRSSKKHEFTVHVHRHKKDFKESYKRVLGKHKLHVPQGLHIPTPTLDKRQQVAATMGANPVQFIANVTVGGQRFGLDFDTGSSDLWVYNSTMAAQYLTGHHSFNSTLSKTWSPMTNGTFNLTYYDNSYARGKVGYDTVIVGPVTVTKQAVEVATQVSAIFYTDKQHDGLLGLGFSVNNRVKPAAQKTWMESALPQFKLPLFSANLKQSAVGSYDFGYANATAYKGPLLNASLVISTYQWGINAQFYAVSGTNYSEPNGVAIVDTGSSIILLSPNACKNYYSKIPGSAFNATYGAYTYPCSTTPPPITLAFGNNNAVVPSTYLTYGRLYGTTCAGAIQSSGRAGYYIYGDPFFKAFYTVFNYGGLTFPFTKGTIGFAPHA